MPASRTHVSGGTGTAGRERTVLTWDLFAHRILQLARERAAARPRLVTVDGYSGAGKTWLADRIAAALDAPVHHVDEYVPGWTGLRRGLDALDHRLLRPWADGRTGHVRLYDWDAGRPGDDLALTPPGLAVLEGSGIASLPHAAGIAVRIWVPASRERREARLAARSDYLDYLPYRQVWAQQEAALVREGRTPSRCDLHVLEADETGVRLALERCRSGLATADI